MPPVSGYDVIGVSVSPSVLGTKKDAISEIQNQISDERFLTLNSDLTNKGKTMANAYIALYCLENHIRDYIDITFKGSLGEGYFSKITISKKTKSGIENRKQEERSKKWLPLRGDSELYYLDFIELADLITNNWDYFKTAIPDQNWINVKLKEMYDIRCLIAHNSFISEENIQLLNVTMNQILKQLYSRG